MIVRTVLAVALAVGIIALPLASEGAAGDEGGAAISTTVGTPPSGSAFAWSSLKSKYHDCRGKVEVACIPSTEP